MIHLSNCISFLFLISLRVLVGLKPENWILYSWRICLKDFILLPICLEHLVHGSELLVSSLKPSVIRLSTHQMQMAQTPLHVASAGNKVDIVKFLLNWRGSEKVELEARNMVGVYETL